jgi:hypothetical protein
MTSIAKKFKVNTDYLRHKLPDEYALIVARNRAERTAKKIAREKEFLAAIRARAERLAELGVWPTARRVLDGMALSGRYRRFMPQLNQILLDVRKQMDPNAAETRGNRN